MGILLSVIQSIFDWLRGGGGDKSGDKYKVIGGDEPSSSSSRFSEKPSTHTACRSCNLHKLTTYQSRIDNLKPDQIVYVSSRVYYIRIRTQEDDYLMRKMPLNVIGYKKTGVTVKLP